MSHANDHVFPVEVLTIVLIQGVSVPRAEFAAVAVAFEDLLAAAHLLCPDSGQKDPFLRLLEVVAVLGNQPVALGVHSGLSLQGHMGGPEVVVFQDHLFRHASAAAGDGPNRLFTDGSHAGGRPVQDGALLGQGRKVDVVVGDDDLLLVVVVLEEIEDPLVVHEP